MRKRYKSWLLVVGFVSCVILVAVLASSWANQSIEGNASRLSCQSSGASHVVTVDHLAASPSHTQAKLCDTLTIQNRGDKVLEIAFGSHDHHTPYDGVAERVLQPGASFSVTLNQPGTFHFHDHLSDKAQGNFSVVK